MLASGSYLSQPSVMCIKLWPSRLHIIPQNSVEVASAVAEWEHPGPHRAKRSLRIEDQIFGPWPFYCTDSTVCISAPNKNDTSGYLVCVVTRRLRILKTTGRSLTWGIALSLSQNGQIIDNSIYLFEWSRGDSLYKSNSEHPDESLFLSLILLVSAELLELFATGWLVTLTPCLSNSYCFQCEIRVCTGFSTVYSPCSTCKCWLDKLTGPRNHKVQIMCNSGQIQV